ncbi:MAG TPA: hypothetical protein VLA76_09820 [Candidatus Angelobacter sp.]|nr:hypothetical protein [Candidatus Angelobacter sp.]
MHHAALLPRLTRVALLLAMVLLLLGSVPARAASSVSIEARPLLDGRYAVGGWAAISVTLVNEGEPTEGHLTAETRSGLMRRFVEMPAAARKSVTLYVQPEAFQRRITVRYEEPNGVVEAVVEVRILEQTSGQVAVVGDGAGNLRPQISAIADGRPAPIALTVGDLPERPEPLDGLSGIAWAADSSSLTDGQGRSLARWVADGGDLVVLGGADWQARTAAFLDLLPVEGLAARDGVEQGRLAAFSGVEGAPTESATVASGTLRDDAQALVATDDGTLLMTMRPIGAGRVVFVGSDLATEAYRGWAGAPALWSRVLPSTAAIEQFWGGMGGREEAENAMSQALGNVPSLEVPPAELLLAVIVGYILLIGPISYVILRRLDRRELAWISAPLLVVLFTACSYGIGSTLKGGDVIVNQISLIRSSTAGGTATVQAYAGIFSPERESFELMVEADALMAQLRPANIPNARAASNVIADQGDPGRLRGLQVGVFGFEGIRADAVVEHEPALQVTWSQEDGNLVGTVTNVADEPIADVAYVSSAGGTRIGDLEPGEEATFTLRRNLNGSSASDGVYGFGGFGGEGERERVVMLRRQVIDALVGYGGWMPGLDLASDSARGPYLIGWRSTPGPLPILVDGVEAQRLNHAVEVIAVRPLPAGGEITVEPGRMSVSIVERDGDIGEAGPGTVFINDGTATFSIALPLEVSGMAVDELEIIAGPDPGMVISEQGGFGGFWPPGVQLELQDPRTGEWSVLGDLGQQSRFEVDDPATAIGDTGRILVRVMAEGLNPNFGGNSFFVSARVSGVLDR